MTSSEYHPLPLDPGPVPASLRDAFTAAEASRRTSSPRAHPADAQTDVVLVDPADDEARLTVIDQLLGSRDGVITLAYLVAARSSSTDSVGDVIAEPLSPAVPLPIVPLSVGLKSAGERRRRINSVLKPVLLAASLMLVAGTSWYVFTLPPPADVVRAAESALQLLAVAPGTATAPITLAWTGLRTTSRYRVEVLDANDAPIFASETNDTSAIVPAGTLDPGTYRWWVRSFHLDGTEIRSRVETLTVR